MEPLALPAPRPRSPSRRPIIVGALAIAGLLVAAYFYWPASRAPEPSRLALDQPAADDIVDPIITNPGYVGPQACAECHAKRSADLQTTKHFRACREPRADEMPVGFQPGKNVIPTRTPGFRFEMLKRGNEYIHASTRQTPTGEERTEARIGLIYGSAPADEIYHLWRGDRLYESKAAWLHPFGEWGYETFDPHGPGDHSRETTVRCVECHNTWLAHVPGTPSEYRGPERILGVTCEVCHGPGRDHVAFHKAHPDEKAAHAVTHPGKLDRERNIEVCTQCHSNANKPRTPAFSYRPGEVLEKTFRTASSKYPEDDHVANQVAYLRQSKCFTKSDSMTCTTCHNPHKPTDHAAVAASCLKCHQPEGCKDRPNLPVAVRDQCASCHMPARVWMNVHFQTADDEYRPIVKRFDHRIGVHPEAKNAVLWEHFRQQPDAVSQGRAVELKTALTQHWLAEADRRNKAYRFLAEVGALREAYQFETTAAVREKIRVAAARQAKLDGDWADAIWLVEQRRTGDAAQALESILAVKPDSAKAHGKLGRLRAELGDMPTAEKHLRAVAEYDPNDAYGLNLLGWLAFLDRPPRYEDSVRLYRDALVIEPYSPEIQTRLGHALLKLNRWPEAAEAFRTATAIDPKNADAFHGAAHALRMQKQPAEAVRYARRAAQLTDRRVADVLITLADAYEDAGRTADARATAEEARAVGPQFESAIRERLARYNNGTK